MHSWVEQTVQDLRYAVRGLRRNPGFTLTAVGAATIAIGASTAVFSAVDRILFRPLPYRDEGRLVSAGIMAPLDTTEFMLADAYFDLRRNRGPFVAVTSFQAGAIACDLTEQSPLRLRSMRVEGNFLDTLGVRLAAGRPFSAAEDRPNGPRVAIISDALWRGRFAADPGAIGKALNIDGVPTRVVGVLPPDFVMPTLAHADILLPEALDEARERQGRALRVFARLKPGISLPQARSELEPYMARVMETVPPQFRKEVTLRVRPLRDRQVGDARAASLALLGAVLAVLLIACANIANLLLARAVGRDREIAVRAALGASRFRLVRLALTESLLVAVAGGAEGCGLAFVLLRGFQAIAPEGLPRIEEATVDVRVLLFSATAAVLSGIVFGLFPALRRTEEAVMGGARTVGPARGWLRGALVTAQIAISVMLLTGAGLLLRSLDNLQRLPMGFESDRAITASFVLGRQRYSRDVEQLTFFGELERRLGSLPGVSAAAVSDSVPPFGGTRGRLFSTIDVEGRPPIPEGSGGMVAWRYVTPGYFAAMGIPMRRGRPFTELDRGASVSSVVLSETLARMMFPGEDPLGKHIPGPVVHGGRSGRRCATHRRGRADHRPGVLLRAKGGARRNLGQPGAAAGLARRGGGGAHGGGPETGGNVAARAVRVAGSDAARGDHHHARAVGSQHGPPAVPSDIIRGVCRHRSAAGGGRAERRDGVSGGAAAAGDRRADGAGGYAGQHREADVGIRGAMHDGGGGDWRRGSGGGDPVAEGAVVPGTSGGFAAAGGRGGAAGRRGVDGGSGAGAAGGASGPGGYVAGGVTSRTRLQRGSCLAGRFEAGRRRARGIRNSGLSLPSLPAAYVGVKILEGDQTAA